MTAPASRRSLALHALTLTQQWPGGELARLADTLTRIAATDAPVRHLAIRTLADQLGTVGRATVSARLVLAAWASGGGALAAAARQTLAGSHAAPDTAGPPRRHQPIDRLLRPLADLAPLNDTETSALDQVLRKLARYKVHDGPAATFVPIFRPHPPPFVAAKGRNEAVTAELVKVYEALQYPAVAEALAVATDALGADRVQAGAFVRELLGQWLERRPVGDALLHLPQRGI